MNYVHLEQLRFGERVQVRYNITSSDFLVPPLTVQPIVENAIRYGITKKADGGVVIIHTHETETEYVVSVNDDGVGFNGNSSSPDASKSHIGMQNVRNRLQLLCGGSLEVSEEDGFTTVTLHFPKNSEKGVENNADNGSRRRAARFRKQRR